MIVIDPRRTETAELADIHLAGQARHRRVAARGARRDPRAGGPGRSRVARGRTRRARRGRAERSARIDVADYAAVVRRRRGAGAPRRATHRARRRAWPCSRTSACRCRVHSTLVSYLQKLVWLLTGNFGKPGTHYIADDARGASGRATRHAGTAGRRVEPGRRRAASSPGLVPVQRHRRGDPHRPSRSATARCSSRAATRRTRSPTASAMREALRRARPAGGDRRRA